MDILLKLNEYRKASKYCNLTLVTGDSTHKAHKGVLAASCDYFAQVLNDGSSIVNVDFITSDDLDIILSYIYTGEIILTNANVSKFQEIAQKLCYEKLEACCKKFQDNCEESPTVEQSEINEIPNSEDSNQHNYEDPIETAAPIHVEIKRSKPVSIFPMKKRSERKAKQDAYKTINQAFQTVEDSEDGFEDVNKRTRVSSDEDYQYEEVTPAPLRPSKRRRSSRTKAYLCPICNKCFGQILTYHFHLSSHDDSSNDYNEVVINSSRLRENMEQVEIEKCGLKPEIIPRKPHLTCDICSKMFTTAHNLSVHLTTHKKNDSDENAKKAKRQHPCTECSKVFGSKSHLRRHMLSHTGIRNHCCTTCGKLFLKNDHLKRHERTHSNIRPFACEECGKTFRDKDHLKRHHLTHSDLRPFFCEICGKQFKERNTLQSHLKLHSASTLACPHCSKTFKTADALKRHVTRHEQEKPHVCEVCGKNFPFVGRLKKHMLTHTGDRPHHCETCGKQFRDAHSLKLHQKKHTGIGLHPCAECGKEFTNPFHLRRHERVHTGEKPFSCDICKRTFSRVDNLEAHKRSCLMKQQGTELVSPVSQVLWTDKNSNLIPVRKNATKENETTLPLSASSTGYNGITSSAIASVSSPEHQSSLSSQTFPTFSTSLPSVNMITNTGGMVADDFSRSKLYALPTQLYAQEQPDQLDPQPYQHSAVQMPTPLHANTQNVILSSQQQQQQILNFDVNAAVNAFIGYGTSM